MAQQDSIMKLTTPLAEGDKAPEQMTNLTIKEQLQLYMAADFAASEEGYGLKFLRSPMLQDKLTMMAAAPDKRSNQIVEAIRNQVMPFGIDGGLMTEEERRIRRRH